MVALALGLLVTLGLSLSDRAPGLIRGAVVKFDLGDDIRLMTLGVDPYVAGHFAIWSCLAIATTFALGRAVQLIPPALVGLFAISIAIEEAQRRLTSIRGFELRDIVANGVGIAAGAGAAAIAVTVLENRRTVLAHRV